MSGVSRPTGEWLLGCVGVWAAQPVDTTTPHRRSLLTPRADQPLAQNTSILYSSHASVIDERYFI